MIEMNKSKFLRGVYDAASLLNHDARLATKSADPTIEKYLAFLKMGKCGLTETAHGWIEGKGYTKECPICDLVLFLAQHMRQEEMVSMTDLMANAMILLEFSEAAWDEYQVLLARYKEVKAAAA